MPAVQATMTPPTTIQPLLLGTEVSHDQHPPHHQQLQTIARQPLQHLPYHLPSYQYTQPEGYSHESGAILVHPPTPQQQAALQGDLQLEMLFVSLCFAVLNTVIIFLLVTSPSILYF